MCFRELILLNLDKGTILNLTGPSLEGPLWRKNNKFPLCDFSIACSIKSTMVVLKNLENFLPKLN